MAKVVKVKPSQSSCCNGCVKGRERNIFHAFESASGSGTSILVLIALYELLFLGQGKGFGVIVMNPRGGICIFCVVRMDFDAATFIHSKA